MEVVPAAADRIADPREAEAPDGRAGQREDGVATDRHAKDACRDRAERAHDRSQAPDEHRGVAPALEPPLCSLQPLRPEMEPAAVAFEQRAASVDPDSP